MKILKRQYPERNYIFSFEADTFTISKKWVLQLCQQIVSNRLNATPWVCQTRVNTLDEGMIKAMKVAGCIRIAFGIESGSQRVLNVLGKGITTEQSINAIKICHNNGMMSNAYIMIGSPTETRQDLEDTVKLIRKARPDYVIISRTTPMLGTKLYDSVSKRGMLNISGFADFDYYSNGYPIKLEGLTKEDLTMYEKRMMTTWTMNSAIPFFIRLFKLMCRFPGYRRFILSYVMKHVELGKAGTFLFGQSFLPKYGPTYTRLWTDLRKTNEENDTGER